jgi:CARDB
VVRVDGGREDVVAEERGWVGSLDAPVVVVHGLATDPPTPRVGEPVSVSVSVTNEGQTLGSRRVPVWLFVDEDTYQDPEIGSVSFDAVAPGETTSASIAWTPDRGLGAGARLEARSNSELRGFRSSPLVVLAADDGLGTETGGN